MTDIISIGSALQDVFLEVAAGQKVNSKEAGTQQLLAFGLDAKVPVETLHRHLGGGAINASVIFTKLGLSAVPRTQVGSDSWGDGIVKRLHDLNIDTALVRRHNTETTGLSVLLHDVGENEHLSFNYKGASDNLAIGEVRLPATKWLYVSALTGEDWRSDIEAIAELAKDFSLAWNPGTLQRRAIDGLDKILENTEVFLLNKDEAFEILRTKGYDEVTDMREMLQSLQEMGPRIIVVTEGRKGAHLYDGTTWFQSPIAHFDTVDTTGTGDTFGATFVAGLILEKDLQDALKMATINSGAVTRQWGAQQGLMTLDEIEAQLEDIEITEL